MRRQGNSDRRAAAPRPPAARAVVLAVLVAALAVACSSSAQVSSGGSGNVTSAGSCGGPVASEYFAGARMVFTGTMLPGPTAYLGGHRVLVSPARVRVSRYLKGHGPKIVTVATAVIRAGDSVNAVSAEGIQPQAGQHWTIYTSSSRVPYDTSICGGSSPGVPSTVMARAPEPTAAAGRGPAHLRITQVTVGRAFPIEGTLSYIRVERANGPVQVHRAPRLWGKKFVIKLDPGVYRLASWQRVCDGNCGFLDAPSNRCERALSVRGGELLQATVRVNFASVQTPCVIVLRR